MQKKQKLPATRLFEILKRQGIASKEDVFDKLAVYSEKKVRNLYEVIYQEIYARQYSVPPPENPDAYRFLASASLRGDTGCPHYICLEQKLDFVEKFSALYCDSLILPLPLRSPENIPRAVEAGNLLMKTVFSLLRLRPLIESDIVQPVVMRTRHCEHEAPKMGELLNLLWYVAEGLAEDEMPRFRMRYKAWYRRGRRTSRLFKWSERIYRARRICHKLPSTSTLGSEELAYG